jgi:RimJ/RimL family protein N-acetyltransferase
MNINEIHSKTMALRRSRKFQEAYQLVTSHVLHHKQPHELAWEHQPVFWSDIEAGICKLTRRNGADAAFIEALWRNVDFVYSFHRHASTFPKRTEDLAKILEQEFVSTIGNSKALHWIVRDKWSKPWGILSLVDISLIHRRAEVMLGVLPASPLGLSTAAMLVIFQFFFKAMRFRKLYSFVYEDNPHSLKGTLHLGFKVEGRLRKHAFDPASGDYLDLIQTGLLAEDAFTANTERLMRRLLAP